MDPQMFRIHLNRALALQVALDWYHYQSAVNKTVCLGYPTHDQEGTKLERWRCQQLLNLVSDTEILNGSTRFYALYLISILALKMRQGTMDGTEFQMLEPAASQNHNVMSALAEVVNTFEAFGSADALQDEERQEQLQRTYRQSCVDVFSEFFIDSLHPCQPRSLDGQALSISEGNHLWKRI